MQVMIDGQEYLPANQNKNHSIGIGITTHNRPKLIKETVAKIVAATPGAKVVVVDDCSEIRPVIDGVEVYSFKHNVGIAKAKNKCLELLADCEHIFLFDDDCYPLQPDWWVPYITSKEHHLLYLFENWASGKPVGDDQIIYEDGDIVAHSHARGCMIYVDRKVLETVGGMDVRYGKAMDEHLDYSNRIYNAGLTTFKYMDVPNSGDLIYSLDQQQAVVSSIPLAERRMMLHEHKQLLADSETSKQYAPFGKDVVIACYLSGVLDVQRNTRWPADLKAIDKLKRSVEAKGYEFVLIHNCFDLPNLTTISGSPYFERWLKEWQYLRDHPEINNVFVVDATDVDMVHNPFPNMSAGTLYVGDEPDETLGNQWLLSRHQEPTVNNWLRQHKDLQMLNCGVVGGTRQLVMDVCRDLYDYHFKHPHEQTEMGAFNMICHSKYSDVLQYGRSVTSLFKKYERTTNAWWRHK
jgi:glycosyltransferase involved in cell wall biosynthesis